MRILPGARFLLAFALIAVPASGDAQNWPERPVRLIIPLGAGSATDIVGRLYADRLSKRWGQPVVVENRPGGDLMIGVAGFTEARDNHTLLLSVAAPITVNPLTHEKLPYDPSDLLPISQASEVFVGIAVPRSLQADTLDQLVSLARLQPGKLSWAATPGGTYLTFAGFQNQTGLSALNVPYRDIVQAHNDLSEARIDIMMCAISIVLPSVQAGKVKLLAVSNRQRAAIAPETPTVDEAGYPALALDANPRARGLLFDMPHMAGLASPVLVQAGLTHRCEFQAGNFFASVPSGGDIYIMKKVLHDWDDDRALEILQNCRAAIPAHGLLLLVELVVPAQNEPSFSKMLDLLMLTYVGGQERTEGEYRHLLNAAGFQLRRVLTTNSTVSIIEAVPA